MDSRTTRRTDQRLALEAFGRVLGKEAHNLTQWPELLWQQLYNRLQWVNGPDRAGAVSGVLAPEFEERSRPGAGLWLHMLTRLRESEALVATVTGAGSAKAVAYSPDGTRIVSGSRHETLKIWDAAGGAELLTAMSAEPQLVTQSQGIRAFDPREYRDDLAKGDVWTVAYSPDGSRIVSGSYVQSMVSGAVDGALRIWDAASGVELATLTKPGEGPVRAVAYSPDGSRIVAGCGDTVRIWDAASGAERLSLTGHKGTAWAVAYSPDGGRIVVGSNDWGTAPGELDGNVKIWDATSGAELATLTQPGQGLVRAVAYSPDGSRIVAGSGDRTVKVWDAASGAELLTLTGHTATVWALAYSPDGTRIVTGADDKTVKIWDAARGTELATLTGHTGRPRAVAYSPDGSRIVSASDEDETLKIWDAASGTELPPQSGHTDVVDAVAYSPDGSRIVSGSDDRTLKIWDAASGAELATLTGHTDEVWAVAYSPDGSRVVSGSKDKTVKIWDAARGTELATLTGHAGEVTGVACSPDGTRIVSSSFDGSLKIWDAAAGAELATLREPGQVQVCAVAYSPDGSRIVSDATRCTSSSGDRPDLRIWDAATGSQLATVRRPETGAVWAVAYSPDGTRIVCGGAGNSFGDDGTLTVWDAVTGAVLHTVTGHTRPVNAVTFSPDGARLVTGSFDGAVKVWDAQTLDCVAVLPLGTVVHGCRHSPRGNRFCCGDSSRTVHILELIGSATRTWDQSPARQPHSDDIAGTVDSVPATRSVPGHQASEELHPDSPAARRDVPPRLPAPSAKKPWYKRWSSKPQ